MIERRESIRVDCEISSRIRDLDPNSHRSRISDALVKNISRGGVCVWVDEFIPVDRELYCALDLPDRECIEVRIVAAWIKELPHLGKYELGARFVEISPDQEDAIENFRYRTLIKQGGGHEPGIRRSFHMELGNDPALAA